MVSFKGHFDGQKIVLDEPASLQAGQTLRIVIDEQQATEIRKPQFGFAKGQISMRDDFDEPLDDFAEYR
jgi:hypothetical protein